MGVQLCVETKQVDGHPRVGGHQIKVCLVDVAQPARTWRHVQDHSLPGVLLTRNLSAKKRSIVSQTRSLGGSTWVPHYISD